MCRRTRASAAAHITGFVLGLTLVLGGQPGLADIALTAQAGAEKPISSSALREFAQISGDPAKPRRHFRLRNPARVEPDEALDIYERIADEMAAAYQGSAHPVALSYRSWHRYNRAPYLSAAHGNRYVNNYANGKAKAYGRFEEAGRLPVGSIIAKDSFSITEEGEVLPAPLFVMEKMPANFNYVTGDWRYTMIMPDGSVFGATKGENAERVEFCIGCHLAVEGNDHLFFVPRQLRAAPPTAE